jgi:hypothetical protein
MSLLGVDQLPGVSVSITRQRLNRAGDLTGKPGIEGLVARIPSIDCESDVALSQGARLAGLPFVDEKLEPILPLRILRL